MRRGLVSSLTAALLLAVATPPAYGVCVDESEPNDQPDGASAFSSDCGRGDIGEEDGQDLWLWNVADSTSLNQLSIVGVPKALTRVELLSI